MAVRPPSPPREGTTKAGDGRGRTPTAVMAAPTAAGSTRTWRNQTSRHSSGDGALIASRLVFFAALRAAVRATRSSRATLSPCDMVHDVASPLSYESSNFEMGANKKCGGYILQERQTL